MLLWLSWIQVECSAWGWAWVPHSILPAAPSPPGFWEEVVGCSTLTSLLAKWFCAWMKEWERGDADLRQVCVVSGVHLSLFQRCRYPVHVGEPQTNQCKPWLCCGCAVSLAELAKGWGIVPLWHWNVCACPDTAKLCSGGHGGWFRECGKSNVVGEVQLQVSAGNLFYIFLVLNVLSVTCGYTAGAVLGRFCLAPRNTLLCYFYQEIVTASDE